MDMHSRDGLIVRYPDSLRNLCPDILKGRMYGHRDGIYESCTGATGKEKQMNEVDKQAEPAV